MLASILTGVNLKIGARDQIHTAGRDPLVTKVTILISK